MQSLVLLFDKFYFMGVTIFIARNLTLNNYGVYQSYILLSSILAGIIGASLPYLGTKIYNNRDSSSINSIFFLSSVIAFFSIILILPALYYYDTELNTGLLIVLVFTQILFPISKQIYIFTNNIKKSLFVNLILYPIFIGLFTFISIVGMLSVELSIILLISLNILVFIASFLTNTNNIMLSKFRFNIFKLINIKQLALITAVVSLTLIIDNMDQLFLLNYASNETFAIYKVGTFRLPFIEITTGAIASVIICKFPVWYEQGNLNEIYIQWRDVIEKTTFFLIPIVVFCIFESKGVVSLLFGEQYIASADIYSLYIAKFLLSSVTLVPILISIGLQKAWLNILVPIALLELTTMFVFTQWVPIDGSLFYFAMIPLIYQYIFIFFQVYILKVKAKLDMLAIFPWEYYLIVLVISVSMNLIAKECIESFSFTGDFVFWSVAYYFATLCTIIIWKKNV
jgi:O-antigen/teichoic acid export membrane protein